MTEGAPTRGNEPSKNGNNINMLLSEQSFIARVPAFTSRSTTRRTQRPKRNDMFDNALV